MGHVWTVSDNIFLLFFENGSHFWTAITLQLVDGFEQIFFLNRSEFNQIFNKYLSAARFGLVFFHKSIKGDFLLKSQLSDEPTNIFGDS